MKVQCPLGFRKRNGISVAVYVLFLMALLNFPATAQDLCQPVGWATQNGGVTGGGNVTPVVVSNYSDLKAAVTSSSVKVVHIEGTITFPTNGKISIKDLSGKSIIGRPGAKLVSVDMTSTGSGIFSLGRCTNFIFRNIIFEGPGAYDADGNDNITLDDCQNIWVDHCDFRDGMDGNFDIKNASDFISVTWCKFSYNKAPIPDGPGGSDDHRFSNLLGSSDGATGDRGKLSITFQYCWWAQGCKARMPRVRFGKVHMVNNYFNSTASSSCVMAGYEANLLVEGNVFENVRNPIDKMSGTYTAITVRNNIFTGTSGNTTGGGTAFTPPYSITIANASDIVTPITTCAGATLPSPTTCSSCSGGGGGNQYPTVSITSPANNATFASNANIAISANASDNDGSINKVEFYNGTTLLGTDNSGPYSYTWNNVANGTYTITAKAYDNVGASSSASITIVVGDGGSTGQPAELIKHGAGSSSQTINLGQSIASFYYNWTNATTVEVTGMPAGISIVIDNNAKSVTFSGTPTVAGTFNYTITTVGGSPDASKSGTITVNGEAPNTPPSISLTAPSDNSVYMAPASVTLTANATDTDGAVILIEYFSGGVKIGEGSSFNWTNISAGTYTLTAVATDDDGARTTSSGITVVVEKANLDCNGVANGSAYLDACGVCVGGDTGYDPCFATLEAEEACSVDGIILESSNAGYSGEGYVNTNNTMGASVSWRLNSDQSQTATFTFKFANGGSAARDGQVYVNGVAVGMLVLPPTGSWTTWSLATINLQITAGANEIRLEALTADGLANLDLINVSEGISIGSCVITGNYVPAIESGFKVYPNPTTGVINWKGETEWTLLSALGKELKRGRGEEVDLSDLSNGIYILKVGEVIVNIVRE